MTRIAPFKNEVLAMRFRDFCGEESEEAERHRKSVRQKVLL
jgi:hypothetical protein